VGRRGYSGSQMWSEPPMRLLVGQMRRSHAGYFVGLLIVCTAMAHLAAAERIWIDPLVDLLIESLHFAWVGKDAFIGLLRRFDWWVLSSLAFLFLTCGPNDLAGVQGFPHRSQRPTALVWRGASGCWLQIKWENAFEASWQPHINQAVNPPYISSSLN